MGAEDDLIRTVLTACPHTQAIYLFGSYGTENEERAEVLADGLRSGRFYGV